ncbi:MAG: hypothetical protein HXX09_02075 [Bacteroidetes bacterium]|nr:hypothetical protein [Bacteroidota bacterium]
MKRKFKNNFISIICLIIIGFGMSNCNNIMTQKNSKEIIVSDSSLLKAFDFLIDRYKLDTNTFFILVNIGNEELQKKSFSIVENYFISDSVLLTCSYFSKYRGVDIIIKTGFDRFNQQEKSYPTRFNRFTKNSKPRVRELHPYTYEYDYETKKDTIFHTYKYGEKKPRPKQFKRGF